LAHYVHFLPPAQPAGIMILVENGTITAFMNMMR